MKDVCGASNWIAPPVSVLPPAISTDPAKMLIWPVVSVVLLVICSATNGLSMLMPPTETGMPPVVNVNGATAPSPTSGEATVLGTAPPIQLAADCHVPELLVVLISALVVVRTVLPSTPSPRLKPSAEPLMTGKVPLVIPDPAFPINSEARPVPSAA